MYLENEACYEAIEMCKRRSKILHPNLIRMVHYDYEYGNSLCGELTKVKVMFEFYQ